MRKEKFNMTQKEITKLRVINQTIDKIITIKEAAQLLDLSERQILRLKKGVLTEGQSFVIHKNRGRKPKHAICDGKKQKIIKLKKDKYKEANFCHFTELLEEEGIKISYSSVHRLLTKAGIESPMKHRKRKAHHRRKRKPQEGMLVQIDASPHEWFLGGEPINLHGAIDDATSKVLALHFSPNECMDGYFEIMHQMVNNHGIPTSVYCDRHTIFVSPKDDKLTVDEQLEGKVVNLTQFGRAIDELGITMIKASSPQAKGRIERLWGTLQSRLVMEFKLRGIDNIEAANAYLPSFIEKFNEKFAVEPEVIEPAYGQLDPSIELDTIFCRKVERTIINSSAISYNGVYYQLTIDSKRASLPPKVKVTVLDSPKIGIKIEYKDKIYDTIPLKERPKRKEVKRPKEQRKPYTPPEDHPWKQTSKAPSFLYEESDRELLERLYNSTQASI